MHNQDAATIQRILDGDKKAYGELVDRHKDKAMTLAMRMLRNREEAEEAIQDSFVRAFHALPRFEWKSSFSTWFYRIVYNVCATQLGRRGEGLFTSLGENADETSIEMESEEPAPDVLVETAEFETMVVRQIEALPASYSSICTLFFVQDLSYDQIAQITDLPLGTVKVRLFRARQILRNAMAKRLPTARIVSE